MILEASWEALALYLCSKISDHGLLILHTEDELCRAVVESPHEFPKPGDLHCILAKREGKGVGTDRIHHPRMRLTPHHKWGIFSRQQTHNLPAPTETHCSPSLLSVDFFDFLQDGWNARCACEGHAGWEPGVINLSFPYLSGQISQTQSPERHYG